jgi:hypothetical protein
MKRPQEDRVRMTGGARMNIRMICVIATVIAIGMGTVQMLAQDQANPATQPTATDDAANARFDAAEKQADAAYAQSAAAALSDYTTQLKAALDSAEAAGQLTPSNLLQKELDRISQGNDIDAAKPVGPGMISARAKYDTLIKRAAKTRNAALMIARRRLLDDETVARDQALRVRDLNKANEINVEILNLEQQIADGDAPRQINLLATLDLTQDTVKGGFTPLRNGLANKDEFMSDLRFAYEPPAEYDFGIAFTVNFIEDRGEIDLLLPHEGKPGAAYLTNLKQPSGIVGFDPNGGQQTVGPIFKAGSHYREVVKVRKDKVSVYLNDALVTECAPQPGNNATPAPWFYIGDRTLGIGIFCATVRIDAVSVREIGEQGRFVKLPPLGTLPTVAGDIPHDKPSRVVDLLALADPKKDTGRDAWVWRKKDLVAEDGPNWSHLKFHYHPPQEYDVAINFTREYGARQEDEILLYKDGHQFAYFIGAAENTYCGFGLINGRGPCDNSTSIHAPDIVPNCQPHTAVIYVRKKFIAATIDGKLVAKYDTDGTDLACPTKWAVDDGCITLAIMNFSHTVFHSVQVAEISGPGQIDHP